MTIDGLNALTTLTAGDELPVWDVEASGEEPTKKITASNLAASVKSLGNLIGTGDLDSTPTQGSNKAVTSGGTYTAIQQSTATFNTIEEHQITKIGNYINERSTFRSRRVGATVIILSYVQVVTQVPATTQFADIGISNAEGVFAFMNTESHRIVTCSGGKLQPDAVLPTGYYFVIGSALAPHT